MVIDERDLARKLEANIDTGMLTNPRSAFFWMLGYLFDNETADRIAGKIRDAEQEKQNES